MEELMSAGERKQRIIADIIEDFGLKPRLNNNRGTAILVTASIYDACHYYRLFQNTSFGPCCGIITSYESNHNAISRQPANSDERYKFDTYKDEGDGESLYPSRSGQRSVRCHVVPSLILISVGSAAQQGRLGAGPVEVRENADATGSGGWGAAFTVAKAMTRPISGLFSRTGVDRWDRRAASACTAGGGRMARQCHG
jgi:hypothetical protein